MESPRKFNDCYFYYYSTCTKGDNCVFRHEPSALGCETMCTAWQQGKCLDKRCKLRHMELRKNRKQIPCYWENQPGGCRKKHCPFMHKNPDARTDGIAPSQPAPQQPAGVSAMAGGVAGMGAGGEGACEPALPAQPAPPLPMLWQHQQPRQVVLDSAILGVLPGSTELVGGVGVGVGGVGPRRVDTAPAYPLPVDPLVVNFEEESDNESAPSSTPTKQDDARAKCQELLLLERIQAEAAAFYSYDTLPPPAPADNDRKIVRTNLNNKYDRLSLDEIAGRKQPPPTERRKSLDFKVLSLDEIRARKKSEAIVQKPPITLNLCRKRKLSTQETVTTSGNKIIKVIRSNSIVYKKVDPEAPTTTAETTKSDQKHNELVDTRKRTMSEASESYEVQENELVDNCYEFKRIKIAEQTFKPKLIRNRPVSLEKLSKQRRETEESNKQDNDSDSEVQIVSIELAETTNIELSDSEIIDVDSTKMGEPIQIVDLSDDDDVTESDLGIIVPDVVASCQKKGDTLEKDILKDIDSILNENNNDSLDEDL